MSSALSTALPYEVLLEALDYAAVNSRDILLPDYRTLRNLSLVSKAVSGYAQKTLFRTVILSKNRHALAFGTALNPGTPKGRALAKLVRTLIVSVGSSTGALTQQLCTAALLACTTLHEFDLTVSNAEFDMSPFSTVFIERASPIEVLRITAPGHIGLALLRVFPSVRYVEFRGWTPRIPQGLGPACRLVELHWVGKVDDGLPWALQRSIGTLSVLAFYNPFEAPLGSEDGIFERLMVAHGPTLRSFEISHLSDSQMTSLRHCSQLEEFIYGSPSHAYNDLFLSAILETLPNTLHHLQVEARANDLLTDTQCIARLTHFFDTAPSLHTVTWVHPEVDEFKELRETCKRREILWRAWSLPLGSFVGERQELGPVKRFPRPVWLSPSRAKYLTHMIHETA